MNKERFTAEEVAKALEETGGIVTVAAARLGCARQTVSNYIQRYESVAQAREDGRDRSIDIAESMLMQQVRNGNITAIIYFLKTQGRHRGWNENDPVRRGALEKDWLAALDDVFGATDGQSAKAG